MRMTWTELIDIFCDWEEQDISMYRKGSETEGCGPMRYYIRPMAMAEKLEKFGLKVEEKEDDEQ